MVGGNHVPHNPDSLRQTSLIIIFPCVSEGQSVVGGNHVPHNPDNLRQTSLLPHVANIPPHILQQMYAGKTRFLQRYLELEEFHNHIIRFYLYQVILNLPSDLSNIYGLFTPLFNTAYSMFHISVDLWSVAERKQI